MPNNSTANVSVGKGVSGGYMFTAPLGTALPADYSTALPETWVNVGFITDEGITHSTDAENANFRDLNGDDIYNAVSSRTRTISLQFAEINARSLGEVYGADNVTVADGTIKVEHNNNDVPARSIVLELVLRDGRRWRRVIENAVVTDWEDVTVVSSELVTFGITYSLNKGDTTGDYIVDYIQETAQSGE